MYDKDFKEAVLLAEKLGVDTVITFSGCPGDCEESKYPNWATCAWPDDFLAVLDWQWNQKVIPYWKETGAFAKAHGVDHIAFEMHPGFCVYNPETLLRLRAAVGDVIGANFDPSHLIWQGMDPVAAIRELKALSTTFTRRIRRSTSTTLRRTEFLTLSTTVRSLSALGYSVPSATATTRAIGEI